MGVTNYLLTGMILQVKVGIVLLVVPLPRMLARHHHELGGPNLNRHFATTSGKWDNPNYTISSLVYKKWKSYPSPSYPHQKIRLLKEKILKCEHSFFTRTIIYKVDFKKKGKQLFDPQPNLGRICKTFHPHFSQLSAKPSTAKGGKLTWSLGRLGHVQAWCEAPFTDSTGRSRLGACKTCPQPIFVADFRSGRVRFC